MVSNETVDLGKFPKGLNNVSPNTDLPEGSLTLATNVDLDKEGNVKLRDGYTQIYSGEDIHSLHQNYFVEDVNLRVINQDQSVNTIHSNLLPNKFLAWEQVNGALIYSDGVDVYDIVGNSFGIPTPNANPTLTETSGNLDAGTYQVAIVFRDGFGKVSGAELASTITVSSGSGIQLTNIPVSPDGYAVEIFCSTQNGEQLFSNIVLLPGSQTHVIYDSRKSKRILDTQFMEPMPGGHILRHFKARLYIANDNVLWFSRAMRYGLHKPAEDFFQFPAKVTIVQPVTDGIYVVADKTYFLAGTDPKKMQQSVVSTNKGIEGTGVTVGGDIFNLESDTEVAYWFSDKGAVLGAPGGNLKDLTEERLALNENINAGVTMLKEKEGIRQMVTNLSNKGSGSGFGMKLELTSQIIRNGVVVEEI